MSALDSALLKAYARKTSRHAVAADFRTSRGGIVPCEAAVEIPEPAPPKPRLSWVWPEICDDLQTAVGKDLDAFAERLLSLRRYQQLQVIAFTGSERGAGRTTFVASLAKAIATSGRATVLLVDADTEHPQLADFLSLTGHACDAATEGQAFTSPIALEPRLNLIARFSPTDETSGTLSQESGQTETSSDRLSRTLEELSTRLPAERENHDLILLDAGPWDIATPLLQHLPQLVDATISVARASRGPAASAGQIAPACCVRGIEHLGTIETFAPRSN